MKDSGGEMKEPKLLPATTVVMAAVWEVEASPDRWPGCRPQSKQEHHEGGRGHGHGYGEPYSDGLMLQMHHQETLSIYWCVVLLGFWTLLAPFTFGYLDPTQWELPPALLTGQHRTSVERLERFLPGRNLPSRRCECVIHVDDLSIVPTVARAESK